MYCPPLDLMFKVRSVTDKLNGSTVVGLDQLGNTPKVGVWRYSLKGHCFLDEYRYLYSIRLQWNKERYMSEGGMVTDVCYSKLQTHKLLHSAS